jgi:hypothetical protein
MVDAATLEVGALVQVRGQQWVVSELSESGLPVDELAAVVLPGRTLVTLTSVSENDLGEELSVIWEVEPGRDVIPAGYFPTSRTPPAGTIHRRSEPRWMRFGGGRSLPQISTLCRLLSGPVSKSTTRRLQLRLGHRYIRSMACPQHARSVLAELRLADSASASPGSRAMEARKVLRDHGWEDSWGNCARAPGSPS